MDRRWKAVVSVASAACLVRLGADIWHCYTFIDKYYAMIDALPDKEEGDDGSSYFDSERFDESCVNEEAFSASLAELAASAPRERMISPVFSPAMEAVARESCVFAAAGRSVLLQIAHPYVAKGVLAHSSVTKNPLARFLKTFRYVHAMMLGTVEEAFGAARTVRRLHAGVFGEMGESVGSFTPSSRYSAHHMDALVWVFVTLVEGAIFAYELTADTMPLAVKDGMIGQKRLSLLFGIPHHKVPGTYSELLTYSRRMWADGRVLAVSDSARKLFDLLFTAPRWYLAPSMWLVRVLALAQMPPRLREAFAPNALTPLHRIIAAVVTGIYRFLYRLLPGPIRYLTAYITAMRRLGRPLPLPTLSSAAATLATLALKVMLVPHTAPSSSLGAEADKWRPSNGLHSFTTPNLPQQQ